MHFIDSTPSAWWVGAVVWCYVGINATRLLTYLPQIVAAWRCRDGARSISLWTWGSFTLSNLTSLLYGMLVLSDPFFMAVSMVNLVCSAAVTSIAARRRVMWRSSGNGVGMALPERRVRESA